MLIRSELYGDATNPPRFMQARIREDAIATVLGGVTMPIHAMNAGKKVENPNPTTIRPTVMTIMLFPANTSSITRRCMEAEAETPAQFAGRLGFRCGSAATDSN